MVPGSVLSAIRTKCPIASANDNAPANLLPYSAGGRAIGPFG
jgi:hypothetical protein